MSAERPLLRVSGLEKRFPVHGGTGQSVRALAGVDLDVQRGETVGLVGESGCGKSTLARCLVRLHEPNGGSIEYDGRNVSHLRGKALTDYHRRVQMVFQDPFGSLNPRMRIGQAIAEAINFHKLRKGPAVAERVAELLDLVGLPRDAADRFPHEFSGGQRQRVAIARALAVEPETLVADELVSALDVSVQAQVVNLLLELQERLHLTVLFVAHDLRLVRHLSHRVAVMYLGRIVEIGETESLFSDPQHPYTRALLSAAPTLDPTRRTTVEAVHGELPSPLNPPSGCPFHPRCPYAMPQCSTVVPKLEPRGEQARVNACHLHLPVAELDKPPESRGGLLHEHAY